MNAIPTAADRQDTGATPSGSGCQPTASAAIAASQSGIPSATYTKGPWEVRVSGVFLRVVHGEHKVTVADGIVSEANAHLIATAPDMLAVNKAAGGILGSILGYMEDGGTMPAIEDIAAAYFATQDVIAKATGGAA